MDYLWENILVLETAIDDMNPEFYPYLIERLLEAGALDAHLQPVIMKKGRPGVLLSALSPPGNRDGILNVIFTETTTLGVRVREEKRACLHRAVFTVETIYGPVRVKGALDAQHGAPVRLSPEFEDCKVRAMEKHAPLREVYQAALLAAEKIILRKDT